MLVALTDNWGCSISKYFFMLFISLVILNVRCIDLERHPVVEFQIAKSPVKNIGFWKHQDYRQIVITVIILCSCQIQAHSNLF